MNKAQTKNNGNQYAMVIMLALTLSGCVSTESGRISKADEEFLRKAEELATQFANVKPIDVEFGMVLKESGNYEDKLVNSTVLLSGVTPPNYVRFQPSLVNTEREEAAAPCHRVLYEKLGNILKTKGNHVQVVFRYTVQNGRLYLLDVTSP